MALLNSKVILFDDSCPMCRLYTHLFVQAGILRRENRIGFAEAPPEIVQKIDLYRGRHEIPLFDRQTGETEYGLRALFLVVESRFPWTRNVLRSRLTYGLLWPFYQLITYNRRVMAGCRACSGYDCAPDLHRGWRSLYIVLVALVVGSLIAATTLFRNEFTVESLPFFGAFLIAMLVGFMVPHGAPRWNYYGNLATIALMFTGVAATASISLSDWLPSTAVFMPAFALAGWETHRRLA